MLHLCLEQGNPTHLKIAIKISTIKLLFTFVKEICLKKISTNNYDFLTPPSPYAGSIDKKMETIKGYQFQLNKSIYLINSKRKFWEVTMIGSQVKYRAGVLRNNQEFKIIQVVKTYESDTLAKGKIITKIADKIDKGYYSTTATKVAVIATNATKKPVLRKRIQKLQEIADQTAQTTKKTRKRKSAPFSANSKEPHKTLWKGFEKGEQMIEYSVRGNQILTTRKRGQEQSTQTKSYPSYDKAVNFVHKKEAEHLKEGFKPSLSQTFIIQQEKTTQRKPGSTVLNPLSALKHDKSLTSMTDDAMYLKSNLDKADEGINQYVANPRLGPPIDHCIKCLLAQNYKDGTDPTGWIMSEKLDGVRCLWTGTQMFSRNGNKFNFPGFFTKNWPKSQLDGQLFIGRGKFSQTISAIKKNVPISAEWQNLKYLVFDAPGLHQPFQRRIKVLQQQLSKVDNPFLKCHAHRPCQGFSDLFYQLDEVNKIGGEGIMLRQPQAYYENKRSKNLQKVKTFHDDQAEIVGYTEGTGRCLGWVGALRVRNGKGVQFEVGSGLNDELRQNPPAIGTKITYKYQQFNKQSGKPRFPTFLRVYSSS